MIIGKEVVVSVCIERDLFIVRRFQVQEMGREKVVQLIGCMRV